MPKPRKPPVAKILDGTWREDRDGDPATIVLPSGAPVMPTHLAGEARTFWEATVPDLVARGIAGAADAAMLAGLCQWWARYRQYGEALDALSPTDPHAPRLRRQASAAWAAFERVAARFGLSPADRSKVHGTPPAKPGVMTRKRS